MRARSVVLATRSAGKVRELRELFRRVGIAVVELGDAGLAPSPLEDDLEVADTFEENALAKARYFFERLERAVVADDSGLEVMALGGRPGVRSKRWSGRSDLEGDALDAANNARLIEALSGCVDRRARYVCAAVYVDACGPLVGHGSTDGTILTAPRGHSGFGYDPYFLSSELGMTFGEASLAAKEQVSHRGRAFRDLLSALEARG